MTESINQLLLVPQSSSIMTEYMVRNYGSLMVQPMAQYLSNIHNTSSSGIDMMASVGNKLIFRRMMTYMVLSVGK